MARIEPFPAIRYDFAKEAAELSSRIAPPYDVLDQADKDRLLARSERNVVAIDLPHIPPKSAGPPEPYAKAADTLRTWLGDGTLVREPAPALYLYHQAFTHDGQAYVRRMFIARLLLTRFAEGVVVPHEETFGGPKEDRLALMKATRCNLSPVFGLYTDPDDEVGAAFSEHAHRKPDASATLDDVENRVWVITDPSTVGRVQSILSPKRIFIADGHHRYGTALMYRDWLAEKFGGALAPEHPANFVMMVLASMDDPGCLILPYPRVLVGPTLDAILAAWQPGVREVSEPKADLVLFDGVSGRSVGVSFTNRPVLATLAADKSDAWRALDLAYVHRYLIDELLAQSPGAPAAIHYVKSIEGARATAREQKSVALLVRATPISHLRAVSEAGDLMPQKSTYFHPKLATGLAIHSLEDAR